MHSAHANLTIDQYATSHTTANLNGDAETPPEEDTVFTRLSKHLGPMNQEAVVTAMLDKIVMNLSAWAHEHRVVKDSLDLLDNLSSGYSSVKLMANLERTKSLLVNHTADYFPFLNVPANNRLRTSFYTTLSRLVFLGENVALFDQFVTPFERVVHAITQQAASMRSQEVLALGIGLCRDLRGVLAGAVVRKSYLLVWEWLSPKHLGVILRLLETWWDQPSIVIPILRFFSELVYNRSQRIVFEPSSPAGIILFREASKAINIYGVRLLSARTQNRDDEDDDDYGLDDGRDGTMGAKSGGDSSDLYRDTLKGISICMQIMARALSGEYVNFGVFELYNDKALSSALNTVVKLMLSVPLTKSLSYLKVAKNYFCFLEILFRNHTDLIAKGDTKIFLSLLSSLHDGLTGFPVQISSHCAASLDHIMCFRYASALKRKQPEASVRLEQHIAESGSLLAETMASIFNLILFDRSVGNQWSLSRPLFSLIVTNQVGVLTLASVKHYTHLLFIPFVPYLTR
jgi:exportin-7